MDNIYMRGNGSTTDHIGQEKGYRGTHTWNTGPQQADDGERGWVSELTLTIRGEKLGSKLTMEGEWQQADNGQPSVDG